LGEHFAWHPALADLALLLLRVAIGIGSLAHGLNKIGKIPLFAADHHLPIWLARVATVTQVAGGALILVGLATFPAALGLTIFGVVATGELIFRKNEPFARPGVHTWDSGVLYTVIPAAVLLAGPGRFALDAVIFAR